MPDVLDSIILLLVFKTTPYSCWTLRNNGDVASYAKRIHKIYFKIVKLYNLYGAH